MSLINSQINSEGSEIFCGYISIHFIFSLTISHIVRNAFLTLHYPNGKNEEESSRVNEESILLYRVYQSTGLYRFDLTRLYGGHNPVGIQLNIRNSPQFLSIFLECLIILCSNTKTWPSMLIPSIPIHTLICVSECVPKKNLRVFMSDQYLTLYWLTFPIKKAHASLKDVILT